jgi:hypothetical protein
MDSQPAGGGAERPHKDDRRGRGRPRRSAT